MVCLLCHFKGSYCFCCQPIGGGHSGWHDETSATVSSVIWQCLASSSLTTCRRGKTTYQASLAWSTKKPSLRLGWAGQVSLELQDWSRSHFRAWVRFKVTHCSMAGPETVYEKVSNSWNSWPLTAKMCMALTCTQLLACVVAYSNYEVGPMYKKIEEDEVAIFTMARNALIIPMCLITLVSMYQVVEMFSPKPRHRALVISRVSMFEFMVKMTYYTLLSRGYGLAVQNQRSFDYRPIYGTRYAGWTIAVPTAVFMNLYPLMDDHRVVDVLIRLFPQMAASLAYCLACGLGCILNDPSVGWSLCIFGVIVYLATIADELAYVQERISITSQPILKGISIAIKEVMFVVYTMLYLLGNWSLATSHTVQLFYSFMDIAHMAVMSSLLFMYWNMDDTKLTSKPDHFDWFWTAPFGREITVIGTFAVRICKKHLPAVWSEIQGYYKVWLRLGQLGDQFFSEESP